MTLMTLALTVGFATAAASPAPGASPTPYQCQNFGVIGHGYLAYTQRPVPRGGGIEEIIFMTGSPRPGPPRKYRAALRVDDGASVVFPDPPERSSVFVKDLRPGVHSIEVASMSSVGGSSFEVNTATLQCFDVTADGKYVMRKF